MFSSGILEIACFNTASAILAQEAGADRIELCEDYKAGGITPSENSITEVRGHLKIPVHVIIRPRGGNFVYSSMEMNAMKNSIAFCRDHGVDGLVLGALTADEKIDLPACKALIAAAGALPLTFHRAIDHCADPETAMQQLIDLGFSSVLTSGSAKNAVDGIDRLKQLQAAYGKHIAIMPGGGIRSSNLKLLLETCCNEYHSAAIIGDSDLADEQEIKKLKKILSGGR